MSAPVWTDEILNRITDLKSVKMPVRKIVSQIQEEFGVILTDKAIYTRLYKIRIGYIRGKKKSCLEPYKNEILALYNDNLLYKEIIELINEKYNKDYPLSTLQSFIKTNRDVFSIRIAPRTRSSHRVKRAYCGRLLVRNIESPQLTVSKICDSIKAIASRKRYKLLTKNSIHNITHELNGFMTSDKIDRAVKRLVNDGFLKPCQTPNVYEVHHAA